MKNVSETANLPKAVPNGTAIFSPDVIKYVERYQSFAKQTANSIVQLGLTIIEAQDKLNPVDFELFCGEIGVPNGGPVYKKLRVIGINASRFSPYASKLPNTWTTLYKLASIQPDQFDRVAGNLNPFITAKEIESLLGETEKSAGTKSKQQPDLVICLEQLDPATKAAVFDSIYLLRDQFKFTINSAKSLQDEIVTLKKLAKAA